MADPFEEMKKRVRLAVAKRLLAAAVLTQAEAKRDLSVPNPAPHLNPAPRGEFPRARTFNLRDAQAISPADLGEIARGLFVRVGVLRNAAYGPILASRGWKGIRDTYARVRDRVRRIIGG